MSYKFKLFVLYDNLCIAIFVDLILMIVTKKRCTTCEKKENNTITLHYYRNVSLRRDARQQKLTQQWRNVSLNDIILDILSFTSELLSYATEIENSILPSKFPLQMISNSGIIIICFVIQTEYLLSLTMPAV